MRINRKRSEPVRETQMVSLADIAFLIIFFFMLSSQFMKDRAPIALPQIPKTSEAHTQIVVSMEATGKLTLNGDEVTTTVLEPQLRKLLEGKPAKECEVRFKCDRNVTYEKYTPIYEAISNAGGTAMIMQDVR